MDELYWIAPEELAGARDQQVTTINRRLQGLYAPSTQSS